MRKKLNRYNIEGHTSLDSLKEQYKELVDTITSGEYSYTIFELDNELSIRNSIESLYRDSDLACYEIMVNFKQAIDEIDTRLKGFFLPNFIRPNSENWWEQGILREASATYVDTVRMMYGIDIAPGGE